MSATPITNYLLICPRVEEVPSSWLKPPGEQKIDSVCVCASAALNLHNRKSWKRVQAGNKTCTHTCAHKNWFNQRQTQLWLSVLVVRRWMNAFVYLRNLQCQHISRVPIVSDGINKSKVNSLDIEPRKKVNYVSAPNTSRLIEQP